MNLSPPKLTTITNGSVMLVAVFLFISLQSDCRSCMVPAGERTPIKLSNFNLIAY